MRLSSFGLLTAALALAGAPVAAQPRPTPVPTASASATSLAKGAKGWRLDAPALAITSEHDDNVFLLTESKKNNVSEAVADDIASGHYAGMRSASDVITTFDAEFGVKGPGIFGRTLSIVPGVRYELYAENAERRNATFRLDLGQSLGHGNELRLRGRMTPSYFTRNYLADATDLDASGTIEPGERLYRTGTHAERELSADFRYRINESTKRSPFGAALRVGAGYYARSFEAPFAGRDLSGPTAKVALIADLSRRLKIDLGYELAALSASPTDEVLLLDEQDVGRDLNGNGSTDDMFVRTVQRVDRSRSEHVVGVGGRLELNRTVDLGAELEHRRRSYGSSEALDVSYNGRSDARNRVNVELGMKVSSQVRLAFTGTIASQSLSRESDFGSTGEVDDYSRRSVGLRVGYRF